MFKKFVAASPNGLALAALLALGAGGAAQASPVDFTFDGLSNPVVNGTSLASVPAGYSVTVGGYYADATNALGWQSAANLNGSGNALSVRRGVGDPNAAQIDSNLTFTEGVLFDFGAAGLFSSLSVTFSMLSATEEVDIWMGNSLTLGSLASPLETVEANNGSIANTGLDGNVHAINFSGMRYLFIAAGEDLSPTSTGCGTGTNCFRVDNIQAVVYTAPPTNGVPEPGSLALAGLALLGLGALRTRRKQS